MSKLRLTPKANVRCHGADASRKPESVVFVAVCKGKKSVCTLQVRVAASDYIIDINTYEKPEGVPGIDEHCSNMAISGSFSAKCYCAILGNT